MPPVSHHSDSARLAPIARGEPGVHPAPDTPAYRATERRHPKRPLVIIPQTLTERTGPVFGRESIGELDHDLTRQHPGAPAGQRIIIEGRVLDEGGRPVPHTLIEIWQANAAGRYAHHVDQWDAPIDANFTGAGRALTDADGRYRFVTVRPGAYPWRNHLNAWRPAHVHFSLFGHAFLTRLVTQMYFPGDPLLAFDPIFNSVPQPRVRERLISRFDLALTEPAFALGYRFDLVLRGSEETPMEGL
jgi:protocatechuate 3,4-dioxygenase, beta subunit